MKHRLKSILFVAALVAPLLAIASSTSAYAVACASPVKYSVTSNTIYLLTPQAFTLSDIRRICSSAPLSLVNASTKTWELSADLVLQNGASLVLHGDNAQAGPGDVNTLRLRSLATNSATDVASITAKWGTIDADSTTVTSWDDAAVGPDMNPFLPAGAPTTDQGRAFVRAVSYLDTDGTSRQSTMNIVNSTFAYLGWYAAESYGVSYKAEGCDHTHLAVCARLYVTGKQTGSHFLHNFMGTYTWGANSMSFVRNEYAYSYMYGLDPHDNSRHLTIMYNHFHHNADHGVICSQKCDYLIIEHNVSNNNGMVPFRGPNGDSQVDGQVHGIMIHRGVTHTTIAYNTVYNQPNGAGIAVFDSSGDSIHDNTVTGAEYGLRISVGSTNNAFTNNTVTGSKLYAVFMYKGSDVPQNSTLSGHPTANVFTNNTVNGSSLIMMKITEADRNVFRNNRFASARGMVLLQKSAGTLFTGNSFAPSQLFSVVGSASEHSSVTFQGLAAPVKLSLDAFSKADFRDATGRLFAAGTAPARAALAPSGSDLTLTSALIGTSAQLVSAQPYTVRPATGRTAARGSTVVGAVNIVVTGVARGQSLAMTAGRLKPLAVYRVRRGTAMLGSFRADKFGVVRFANTPGAASSVNYRVSVS